MIFARTHAVLLVVVSLALGCGRDDEDDRASPVAEQEQPQQRVPALLTLIVPEPEGTTCAHGGQRIQVGLDDNANATLEPEEVRSSSVVCNAAGALQPVAGAEPPAAEPSASCPMPGTRDVPPREASWHKELTLSGAGFVALRSSGAPKVSYYARKVVLHFDKAGCLSTGDDLQLLGFHFEHGLLAATLEPMCVGATVLSPTPTSRARLYVNLDENSVVPVSAYDPTHPDATSNFSSSLTVYDSLGDGHLLTMFYNRRNLTDWEWHAQTDGSDINGGTPGVPFESAAGTLRFSHDGALQRGTQAFSTWDFVGAAPRQEIDFDFGNSIENGGTGLEGSTNFASPSTTNAAAQDGHPAGSIDAVSISGGGAIHAVFTNDQRRLLGNIPIASFPATDQLAHACDGLWIETAASGAPLFGDPQTLGRGSFVPVVD